MKNLRLILKKRYGLAVGEKTLAETGHKAAELLRKNIRIAGRSYVTGRKKTIRVSLSEF